jgi:nucleotide-binding universal stress UspA family protein
MFSRIVVGLDGSAGAERALAVAIRLAAADRADLFAVSVTEGVPRYAGTVDEVRDVAERAQQYFAELHAAAREDALRAGVDLKTEVLAGQPAQRIVDYARTRQADLLVIGHSGHGGTWGSFLGSNADKLVRHAPCSVLVVRDEP